MTRRSTRPLQIMLGSRLRLHIDAGECCSRVYREDIMTEFTALLSSSADRVLLHEMDHRINNESHLSSASVSCRGTIR